MNQQITQVERRDYHDVISKVAGIKNLTAEDLDKLQRMMAMQEEWEKRQAATNYNEQMSLAQGDMTQVSKDSSNSGTHSKYASLPALDAAIRPIYTKYGFSVAFNDETPADRPDWLRLVAYVSNGAETRTFTKWIPVSTTGLRGQQALTPTHASIGAVTYGRRALLKMIFNLAEADDDGAAASGYKIKEDNSGIDSPATKEDMIAAMRACKDHTALYSYGQQSRPLYLKLFPPDRKELDAIYKQMMEKFAEDQK